MTQTLTVPGSIFTKEIDIYALAKQEAAEDVAAEKAKLKAQEIQTYGRNLFKGLMNNKEQANTAYFNIATALDGSKKLKHQDIHNITTIVNNLYTYISNYQKKILAAVNVKQHSPSAVEHSRQRLHIVGTLVLNLRSKLKTYISKHFPKPTVNFELGPNTGSTNVLDDDQPAEQHAAVTKKIKSDATVKLAEDPLPVVEFDMMPPKMIELNDDGLAIVH